MVLHITETTGEQNFFKILISKGIYQKQHEEINAYKNFLEGILKILLF